MLTFKELGQYGRFGNQLFQIAGTIGHAAKAGYNYGFPKWKERKHFINPLPLFTYDLPVYKVPFMFNNFTPPDNVSLRGYMMSPAHFNHCPDLIKYYFKMKPIKGLPKIKKNSVAIHIRRGDYGSDYFPYLKNEYYQRAFNKLLDYKIKISELYVFSDDIKEAREIFPFGTEYIETGSYIKDFYLMQKCKYFIIANSTFSWWAAWLSGSKKVIAPAQWFGGAMKIYENQIYCKNWEVI